MDRLSQMAAQLQDAQVTLEQRTRELADVRAQRTQLESQFQHARECFEQGMSYDAALQAFGEADLPLDFQRLIILASYCEFTGKRPEGTDPASRNHMTLVQGIATEAKLLLGRK